mmetsp:Transcript_13347/g.42355  ORF Transcript_13347/g.42355 Transcript_13347/m.42355 type:complete len:230 (+) Transcript_13347:57-746(+)
MGRRGAGGHAHCCGRGGGGARGVPPDPGVGGRGGGAGGGGREPPLAPLRRKVPRGPPHRRGHVACQRDPGQRASVGLHAPRGSPSPLDRGRAEGGDFQPRGAGVLVAAPRGGRGPPGLRLPPLRAHVRRLRGLPPPVRPRGLLVPGGPAGAAAGAASGRGRGGGRPRGGGGGEPRDGDQDGGVDESAHHHRAAQDVEHGLAGARPRRARAQQHLHVAGGRARGGRSRVR